MHQRTVTRLGLEPIIWCGLFSIDGQVWIFMDFPIACCDMHVRELRSVRGWFLFGVAVCMPLWQAPRQESGLQTLANPRKLFTLKRV